MMFPYGHALRAAREEAERIGAVTRRALMQIAERHGVTASDLCDSMEAGDDQRADERLIDAAPDLLAACKAALVRSNMPDQPAFDSLRAQLRAAIAKAEGEAGR